MIAGQDEDRGVSEVVGFILVFAVVIISVGLLYTTAFQSMHSYQEGEQVKSAAQGMEALASNFNDVLRQGGTDQRSGELTLRDGTVRTDGSGGSLTVDIDSDGYDETVSLGKLTYQYGSSTIAYEGGGVFQGVEDEPDRSAVTSQPALACGDDRAVVSVLSLDGDERSIQASGTQRFTLVEQSVESRTFTGVNGVSLAVSGSAHQGGWDAALDRNGWNNGSCTASTVVVRIVRATVEF
ncbi:MULTISPECIES: DUF7289 family protein [Saliphagus]|uniref:Archaellin/type IV pilin N-terminal domain-containing protein n=1 Tax=Saliphagus infecundisoli TaxID=1849069 RepID=A0ABD5QC95_9EURY|nr:MULTISPECIES: archaellin/type IV pilin N-terminal domain-containing protein [Saliphagus]